MNTFLIAILSSFLVFQNETPAPDSLSTKVDTAFLLGYRANRGDAIALLESCKKPTNIPLTEEKNKAEVVSRLKEMRVQPANLRSAKAIGATTRISYESLSKASHYFFIAPLL